MRVAVFVLSVMVATVLASQQQAVSPQLPVIPNLGLPMALFENLTDGVITLDLAGSVTFYDVNAQAQDTLQYFAQTSWTFDGSVLSYTTYNGSLKNAAENLFFEEVIALDPATGITKDQLTSGPVGSDPQQSSYRYTFTCPPTWTDGGSFAQTGCSDPVQVLSAKCLGGRRSPNGVYQLRVSLCEQSLFDYSIYYQETGDFFWNATLKATYEPYVGPDPAPARDTM